MGHVADIFTPDVLAELPGKLAIGHTRYSTAGDTALLNAQPFSVACNKGPRRGGAQRQHHQCRANCGANWKRDGSIFQATSDTEVILHLVARSRGTHAGRAPCARLCCSWKARSRWCFWRRTASSWRAIRTDSGRWRWARWN